MILIPFSFALITPVFEDNEILINWSLNYSGTYTSNTEFNFDTATDGTACMGLSLYDDPNENLSMGGESGSGCTIGSLHLIGTMPKSPLDGWGSGNEMIVFNFSSTNENDMTRLWFRRSTHASAVYIGFNDPAGEARMFNRNQIGTTKQCSGNMTNDGQSRQYIAANFGGDWHLYEDDTLICQVESIGSGRDLFDFFFYADPANTNVRAIPYIIMGNGSISVDINDTIDCQLPLLFCDQFNYLSPISEKGWTASNIDNSFNTDFGANDTLLVWNGADPKAISQNIDTFDVSYDISEGVTVTTSQYAPVFSTSFKGTFLNTTGLKVDYKVFDTDLDLCTVIRFESLNSTSDLDVKILNITTLEYDTLSNITKNIQHDISFNYLFETRSKEFMPFNTSFVNNSVNIFINNAAFHFGHPSLMFPACDNFYQGAFVLENESSSITIDDYFVYLGTDTQTDTTSVFSFPKFIPAENVTIPTGSTGTADFAETVDDLWEQFGLITVASKVLFGLLMIAIIVVFTAIAMLKIGMFSFPALVTIAGVFLIIEVFLGLIPLWIFGLMALIGTAIAVLVVKLSIQ